MPRSKSPHSSLSGSESSSLSPVETHSETRTRSRHSSRRGKTGRNRTSGGACGTNRPLGGGLREPAGRVTSDSSCGFDFTTQMWRLCQDAVGRVQDLAHIQMSRVAVTFCQARSRSLYGLQAKLTPLRFEGGRLYQQRGGQVWTIERVHDHLGQEVLYILSFYLPRFLEQPTQEKLTTIFHELLHVSPQFNGDLRRFPGRCYAHSSSQKQFDAWAERLAADWLSQSPPAELYGFLQYNFADLQRLHGRVHGLKIRTPKLVPVSQRV